MGKIKLMIAMALIGILALPGCSSHSSSASPTYAMKATTGTATMDASACVAGLVGTTMAISGSTVTGGVGGPPQINISIANWTNAAATYSIGSASTSTTFAEYTASASSLTLLSQSGTVTITSVSSTTISGTFNFTCTDGTVISSGTFTAKVS